MGVENLIQRGDLIQRLTRALEIKGQKSPVLQLDSIVSPMVVLSDLSKQADWEQPVERKLSTNLTAPGVAANTNLLVVTNPLGSGVIGVVERITACCDTTNQLVHFGLIDPVAVPATPEGLEFRDRRILGAPALRAFSGNDTVLRVVTVYVSFNVSTSIATPWYETPGLVIQPGDTFGFQNTTVQTGTRFTIWLEEIPLG